MRTPVCSTFLPPITVNFTSPAMSSRDEYTKTWTGVEPSPDGSVRDSRPAVLDSTMSTLAFVPKLPRMDCCGRRGAQGEADAAWRQAGAEV
jgi:hypothetical protein